MLIPDLDFSLGNKYSFRETAEYPFKEKYTKIDGVEVCYVDEGKGFPILFIHGLGGNLLHYSENIPHFKEKFRTIAIDLPGYGKSDKPVLRDPVMYYVKMLKKFVRKLGIDELILVGNSMGGHISAIFSAKFKKMAAGLVLADPAGMRALNFLEDIFINTMFNENLLSRTPSYIMETSLKHNFYHARKEAEPILQSQKLMVGSTDYEAYCKTMELCAKSMNNNPLDDILAEIICPTLIVWGNNDRLIDVKYAELFQQGIKNSELHIYDYCGHISMLEKFEDFNAHMDEFIKNNELAKKGRIKKIFKIFGK